MVYVKIKTLNNYFRNYHGNFLILTLKSGSQFKRSTRYNLIIHRSKTHSKRNEIISRQQAPSLKATK
jgi:hypothetical protein